jgi:DNA invertase Pin-like site-specific DNA recombinase
MAKIGYIRVSKNDQNTDLQRKALMCAHCDQIFEDKISGKTDKRPGLKRALKRLKPDDTLVVWKLDRLGRSIRHLITLVSELEDKGMHFHSLTDAIDTSTSAGRFFFHVMSALAQMEHELIVERTRAGLAAARSRGRIGGRKPLLSESQQKKLHTLLEQGQTRKKLALMHQVSLSTMYRYCPVQRSMKTDENDADKK